MNRAQLEHVLRAAATIVDDPDLLVIGSQAVLGSFADEELPLEATTSIEADLAFVVDPDGEKADRVDGAIGELSPFHESFGYYAQGVSVTTRCCRRPFATAWVAATLGAMARAGWIVVDVAVKDRRPVDRRPAGRNPQSTRGTNRFVVAMYSR